MGLQTSCVLHTWSPSVFSASEIAGASLLIRSGTRALEGVTTGNQARFPSAVLSVLKHGSAGVLSSDQKEWKAGYTARKLITASGKLAHKLFKDPVVFTQEKSRMFLREEVI